jgi:RsiW-degrading membrane proteinase PrsW (M82 family)
MPDQKEDVHMRGNIIALVVGVSACALGGMLFGIASSMSPSDQPVPQVLGNFLLVIGAPIFFISVLVELFSIGTSVRSIAKSSDAALSLLKSQSVEAANPAPPAGHPVL